MFSGPRHHPLRRRFRAEPPAVKAALDFEPKPRPGSWIKGLPVTPWLTLERSCTARIAVRASVWLLGSLTLDPARPLLCGLPKRLALVGCYATWRAVSPFKIKSPADGRGFLA